MSSLKKLPKPVKNAIRQGGWEVVRDKKHFVLRRMASGKTEFITISKSPSDRRTAYNAIADLTKTERMGGGK